MRLSRPCYDKMHRCPGWAGGGNRYARVQRCTDGRLVGAHDDTLYTKCLWWLRFNRCTACDVLVLPYAVRFLDPTNWRSEIRMQLMRLENRTYGLTIERNRWEGELTFSFAVFLDELPRRRVLGFGIDVGLRALTVGYAWRRKKTDPCRDS